MRLIDLNKQLYELDQKYAVVYPKFKKVEYEYLEKYDKALIDSTGLGTQQLRESAVRELLRQDPLYEKYLTLSVEVDIILRRIRVLTTISSNIRNLSFGGGDLTS